MDMKNFFVTILAATFLFSCEKIIDLDVPESDPQLVVDAWYTDEDTAQYVKLSTTAPYFDEAQTPRVSGAEVLLHTYEDGALTNTETLEEDPNQSGYYIFNSPAELGKGYQLEVNAPAFDPVKSDIQQILETPPILDISWEEASPDVEDSLAIYEVYIATYEIPGPGDFYRWFVYVDEEYLDEPENINVQSDELVDGAILPEYEVTSRLFRYGQTVRIKQCRINESAYDYLSLLLFQTAFIGSPFDTPPAPLVGNMKFIGKEGHALGFFGASSTSIAEVVAGQ